MKFTLKDETKVGMCTTCAHAAIVKFDDCTTIVKCTWLSKQVTRAVEYCTVYKRRGEPSLFDMKMAAWLIDVDPKRKVGFKWLKPRAEGREELLTNIGHLPEHDI